MHSCLTKIMLSCIREVKEIEQISSVTKTRINDFIATPAKEIILMKSFLMKLNKTLDKVYYDLALHGASLNQHTYVSTFQQKSISL
jgi:hypothetical protein